MTPTIQLLLLATFAFICLTPGEALVCRVCMSMGPGAPCIPKVTCEANPATHICSAQFFMYNGQVHQKILGCKAKVIGTCGTTNAMGIRHACCEDRDFCNERL